MSYTFADAAPVQQSNAGRKAADNPFIDVVQSIALKLDEKGKPVAKSFIETHAATAEARETAIRKVKYLLGKAGDKATPIVSVIAYSEPVKEGPKNKETDSATKTLITFWTVTKIRKAKKDTTEATTEATEATTENATA